MRNDPKLSQDYDGPRLLGYYMTLGSIEVEDGEIDAIIESIPQARPGDPVTEECLLLAEFEVGNHAGEHRISVVRQDTQTSLSPVVDWFVDFPSDLETMVVRVKVTILVSEARAMIFWLLVDGKRVGRIRFDVTPRSGSSDPTPMNA